MEAEQHRKLSDDSKPCLARGVRLQEDASTGEPVLLFPEGVLHLSETAREILRRCDGQQTVSTIITGLAEEYDAPPETLRTDVLECLMELYQRKLVVA